MSKIFAHVHSSSPRPSTSASGERTSSGASAECEAVVAPSGRVRSPLNSSSFEKARPAGLPGASRVDAFRQSNGGTGPMPSSSPLKTTNFAPQKSLHSIFSPTSEQELAKEFSAQIIDFDTGRIAQSTGRSKETVKCWKAGRSFPNGASLLALIAEYPRIREWANRRTGGISNPQSFSETMELLEQLMSSNSPEGRALRARMAELLREGSSQ